jgi:pimeloyl-ACP methyl ester carboxylesterase
MLAEHQEQWATLPNQTSLCFSQHGDPKHPCLMLIAGLGLQMVYWPERLITPLVNAGLHVICFDNRDAGRSSRSTLPFPSKGQQLLGKAPENSYALEHMAQDSVLLLKHLGIQQAHVVGMSMGGMIAQSMAIHYPEYVASLVSIFSTTGERRVGQPSLKTLWRILRTKAPQTEQQAVDNYTRMMTHIGDSTSPNATAMWQQYASLAWQRNGEKAEPKAMYRQIGAIIKSGNRTRDLRNIAKPSLIIHGDKDPMVHPSGGLATANAIPQSQYRVIKGMRHQIDDHQSSRLVDLINQHIDQIVKKVTCN